VDAGDKQDVFCSCYNVTSAVTQPHYCVSDLLISACKPANDFPHHNQKTHIFGFAIIKLLFNDFLILSEYSKFEMWASGSLLLRISSTNAIITIFRHKKLKI